MENVGKGSGLKRRGHGQKMGTWTVMRKKIGMMANGWKLRRTDEEWERGQRIDRKW